LKTKDRSYRIREKRLQAIEKARVRARAARGVEELSSREHAQSYYGSGPVVNRNLLLVRYSFERIAKSFKREEL